MQQFSNKIMQSVGEKLRRARLEKSLSLDQVYKETKIHPRVLEGLEQDRAHNFLSHLYIKGFLRTYARYLGLDEEKLLKEYIDSRKLEPSGAEVSLKKKRKVLSLPFQINPVLIFRVATVLIVAFALILYFRFVLRRISQSVVQEAAEKKVKVRVIPAAPIKEDLVLEVKTKDVCWMRVKVDNQAIFEKTLPKGKNETWQAKERIELRIGKPEALEVFLNGRRIDLKKAQVKRTLLITHEGIKGK